MFLHFSTLRMLFDQLDYLSVHLDCFQPKEALSFQIAAFSALFDAGNALLTKRNFLSARPTKSKNMIEFVD